jgi:phage terminase large subunit-like protein
VSSPAEQQAPPPPPELERDPHVAKALAYVDDVLTGRVPACKFVRQACARQRRDLERWGDGQGPYAFSEAAAGRACRFIELLPHVQGEAAKRGEHIRLEPWQCFVVTTVFGWLRTDNGARRYRRVYVEICRGNGKTFLAAAIALYGLAGDGEPGAEVYAAATTKGQARKCWTAAKLMIRKEKRFAKRLGLRAGKELITHGKSNSTFAAMTRDADTEEGQTVHFAVVDELHVHKTRDVYDVVETATSKRGPGSSSLLWCITTAGKNFAGICFEVRSFCVGVLDGTIADESQFAVIYTIDESDDWTNPEAWRRANPNWGVSVDPVAFEALARKAIEVPSARANFKRKHLDIWEGGDETWLPIDAWDACADVSLKLSSFTGQPAWLGLDLASKQDLAALAFLFERIERGGVRHVYLFVRLYLPEAAVRESRNSQYGGWVEQGLITVTPGNVLDFEALKADIREASKRFRLQAVAYDPWQSSQLSVELLAEGVPMVEVGQNRKRLSEPMQEFAALTLSGRMHHEGSPALRWQVSNVVVDADPTTGAMRPVKERPELKIDGVVAAIIGLSRLIAGAEPDPNESPYTGERGLLSLP